MARNVLFVPGMMLTHSLWAEQVRALEGDFTCSVAELTAADSMAGLAEAVLAQAPGRFDLVGFSLGAIVGMAMWRRAPERIASMALLGFSPHADAPARRPLRELQMERARTGELLQLARDEWAPGYFDRAAPPAQRRQWTEDVVDMAAALGPEVFCQQTRAQLGRPDSVATLAGIDVPALVVRGDDDRMVPASDLDLVSAQLPRAHAVTLENCGHLIPLECPQALNGLLRSFLNDLRHEH